MKSLAGILAAGGINMLNRRWLLVGAACPIVYGFVLIRQDLFLRLLPSYGETDIYASVAVAIALLASWTVLEVAARRDARRAPVRACGFSLRGLRCPECGRSQGEGAASP